MSESDKYTQNLVVRQKRTKAEVNPETEEAFEESKELVKESVHKAASVNLAFLTWLGIFCYRLCQHLWGGIRRRLFTKKQVPSSRPHTSTKARSSSSSKKERSGGKDANESESRPGS